MRLLLHICCANCALYPVKTLSSRGEKLGLLWFNPNIHPQDEYQKRLDTVKRLEAIWGLDISYIDRYGLAEFDRAVAAHKGVRCEACYRVRLRETAYRAAEAGFDAFSTTLLVSPYQKFDLIVEAAREAERESSVPFYFEDFRPGYREGLKMSRELGLYRQNYCGCIYSKAERETERKARSQAGVVSGSAATG